MFDIIYYYNINIEITTLIESILGNQQAPIESKYNATIRSVIEFHNPQTGLSRPVIILTSKTMGKMGMLLGDTGLVEFNTPFGKQEWVDSIGICSQTGVFLVGDGADRSVGVYTVTGSPQSILLSSGPRIEETVFRIEKGGIDPTPDNQFKLNVKVLSLMTQPCVGPRQ